MKSLILALPFDERPYSPEDVLLYYDGPQLFWLTCPVHGRFLLAGLPDDAGPWPFIAVLLPPDAVAGIECGRLTLQKAFMGTWPRYHVADYGAPELRLQELREAPPDWLPGDVTLNR